MYIQHLKLIKTSSLRRALLCKGSVESSLTLKRPVNVYHIDIYVHIVLFRQHSVARARRPECVFNNCTYTNTQTYTYEQDTCTFI